MHMEKEQEFSFQIAIILASGCVSCVPSMRSQSFRKHFRMNSVLILPKMSTFINYLFI